MKMRCFLLFVMAFFAITANAQNLQEVVYLKNGSIIRGIIIEQVPNESLKIQTADGSVFAYPMDEVEKITKEPYVSTGSNTYSKKSNSYDRSSLQKGYRGFVDLGYSVGVGNYREGRIEFSTAHGYQITPYLFAGIGAGVQYYFDDALVEIPIFADIRSEFLNSPISPFVDFRIGYTVYDASGFYLSPSVGCRFPFKNSRAGISLGVGYTMQQFKLYYSRYSFRANYGAITFKVAFDF